MSCECFVVDYVSQACQMMSMPGSIFHYPSGFYHFAHLGAARLHNRDETVIFWPNPFKKILITLNLNMAASQNQIILSKCNCWLQKKKKEAWKKDGSATQL